MVIARTAVDALTTTDLLTVVGMAVVMIAASAEATASQCAQESLHRVIAAILVIVEATATGIEMGVTEVVAAATDATIILPHARESTVVTTTATGRGDTKCRNHSVWMTVVSDGKILFVILQTSPLT